MADSTVKILLNAAGGKQVAAELLSAQNAMQRVEAVGRQVTRSLSGLFAPVLAGVGVAELVRGFGNIVDSLDDMAKAAQRAGVTVETLSALKYAADLSGVSFEQLETGLAQFSRRLAEIDTATTKSSALLRQFGVTAADDTRAGLAKIADAFAKTSDGATKTAAAYELFGRAGTQLIPLLNAGSAGLDELAREAERLGLVMDTETAKAAEQLNDDMTRLKAAAGDLGRQMAFALVPGLSQVAEEMVRAANEGRGLLGVLGALGSESLRVLRFGTGRMGFAAELGEAAEGARRLQQEVTRLEGNLDSMSRFNPLRGLEETKLIGARNRLAELSETTQDLVERDLQLQLAEEERTRGLERQEAAIVPVIAGETKLARTRAAGAGSARTAAAETRALDRTVDGLVKRYLPAAAAAQEYAEAERAVAAAVAATRLTQEQGATILAKMREEQAKLAESGKTEADAWVKVWERGIERLDDAFAGFWENLFQGTKSTLDSLKQALLSWLAEMAHALTTRQLTVSIGAALGIGGTGTASAAGSAVSGLSSMGNLLGSGGSMLFNAAKSLFTGAAFSGISTGFGMAAANIGAAGYFGGMGANLALAGSSLGSGAIGTAIGAAAPYLAPALIAIPLIAKAFGDKTDPRAQFVARTGTTGFEDDVSVRSEGLGVSFGLGGKSHKVDAAEYQGALALFAGAADAIAAAVGPAVADAIRGRVASTTDQMKGAGLARDGWSAEAAFAQIFTDILGFAADTGDALATVLAERAGSFSGSLESMAQGLAQAAVELQALDAMLPGFHRLNDSLGESEVVALRAASAIADQAGGVETLAAQMGAYYEHFFTAEERAIAQRDQALADIEEFNQALGGAASAANFRSKDALRDYVESLDLTTSWGQYAYAQSMSVVGAFIALDEAMAVLEPQAVDLVERTEDLARAEEELARVRADLELRLIELSEGPAAALAERRQRELAALDESLRPMLRRIFALEDEAAAAQAAAEAADELARRLSAVEAQRQAAELRLIALSEGASAALAEQRRRELAATDESLRPLLERVYLLEDEAAALEESNRQLEEAQRAAEEAAAEAARIADERLDLEVRLARALGDETRALALERARELDTLDASNRALAQRLYLLEDAQRAADDAYAALERAVDAQRDAIEAQYAAELAALETAHEAQMAVFDAQIEAAQDALGALNEILSSLQGAISGLRREQQAMDRLAVQRAQRTLRGWAAGGTLPGGGVLGSVLETLTGDTAALYSSAEAWRVDQARNLAAMQQLEALAEQQISTDEASLAVLEGLREEAQAQYEAAREALDAWRDAELDLLDALLDDFRQQLDTLRGIDTSVLTIAQATANLEAALIRWAAAQEADGGLSGSAQYGAAATLTAPGTSGAVGSTSATITDLIAEVRALRLEVSERLATVATNSTQSTQVLRRWDGDGLPVPREDITLEAA